MQKLRIPGSEKDPGIRIQVLQSFKTKEDTDKYHFIFEIFLITSVVGDLPGKVLQLTNIRTVSFRETFFCNTELS